MHDATLDSCFAYGSNLNLADWHGWCRDNGIASDLLQPIGVARLLDYRLAFSRRSIRRGGGALNVVPAIGHVVEGMLFQVVGNEGWIALDKKEGAPRWYHRTPVYVQREDGQLSETTTYVVAPEFCEPFVNPAPGYVELVCEGLKHWGLSSESMELAANNDPRSGLIDRLFCYGTLMQGECRFPILKELGFKANVPACTRGELFDLGPYPGMVNTENANSVVLGELFTLPDVSVALKRLDEVEGFDGHGAAGNLYSRRLLSAETVVGQSQWAWGYCCEPNPGANRIENGSWKSRSRVVGDQ